VILAGDIGGTHTRLALFKNEIKIIERKFLSRNYPGLENIITEFLLIHKESISTACFGVAGPVKEGKVKATNLPWVVDASLLSQKLKIAAVFLLNDLEANTYGLKKLEKDQLFLIQKGNPDQKGNQALISAGTGLGQAGLFWDGRVHHPFACEGGHTDFAPRNELEVELFWYLKNQLEHVSYERVVSGPGLLSLYRFLIETKREKTPSSLKAAMEGNDPSSVISKWALENKDPGCVRALDWFVSLYGAEAGNLALKLLSLGGLYIGGGIAPHIKERLKNGPFLSSFADKGRFKEVLESIPIWVILNDDTALLGAASYGEMMGK